MELDDSSEVKRCSESQLTQNSSITVTIDDLTEGLIVVSFAHSDNLYQGVLFQLNRERGIPSGISFAKEHVLGTSTSSVEKSESDPSQTIPLHQRHSYNQGICNGTSHSPISQPSLRRIIKPPARFKNARMSLRLRARPVLCAKCRSLCDDKADSSGKDEPPPKDENPTEKSKRERVKVSKREPSNTTTTPIGLHGKLRESEQSQGCSAVDPQDLCYESVGSTRVVENYWRRPLVKPLIPSTEETYARLRKHKGSSESGRDNSKKKVKTTSNPITNSNSTTASSNHDISAASSTLLQEKLSPRSTSCNENVEISPQKLSTNHTTFVTKSNVCDTNFPNTRSRKALNLKMCITKIAELRNGANAKRAKERNKSFETLIEKKDDESAFVDSNLSPLHHHSDSSLESTEMTDNCFALQPQQEKTSSDECSGLKTRASSKKSKAWENRIRTKSTVPVRYRDESYLTKNIFNFNKRRPLSSSSGDIPVLTISRIDDDENIFKVSTLIDAEGNDDAVTTSEIDDNFNDSEKVEIPISTVQSSSSSPLEQSEESHYHDDGSRHSPSSSSNLNEVPAPISIKSSISKPPTELIKTPTIKITFGSSGNGMVVQIPPKITQHVESTSTTDMKAVRKAMKKAKKEAKRRRSISPDYSPSSNAFSPDQPSKSERSNPTSPVTPAALIEPQDESELLQSHNEKSLIEFSATEPSTSTRVPKKKKKQKKRRRSSKVLKENDGFTSSSSSHEPIVYSMSSPHSTSSCNHDASTVGYESPSGTSVKSCNLADSVSNSSAQESVQNFGKDTCPPRRRRSMPATSTTSNSTDVPRVCINLKRIDTNAYVPLPLHSLSSHSDNDDPSSLENNGVDVEEAELNDFPINNGSPQANEIDILGASGESLDFYKDKETECSYRKGDIVWGKLPQTPWWPGKIDDILSGNGEETRAKVSWYKSTTQSCMRFKMLVPFTEYFDSKYARSRRRGLYQHAVKDALVEAHKVNPQDLPTD